MGDSCDMPDVQLEPTETPTQTKAVSDDESATVSHTHIRKLFFLALFNTLFFIFFRYHSSVLTRIAAYVLLDIRGMIVLKYCQQYNHPWQITPRQVLKTVIQRQQTHTSVSHTFPIRLHNNSTCNMHSVMLSSFGDVYSSLLSGRCQKSANVCDQSNKVVINNMANLLQSVRDRLGYK